MLAESFAHFRRCGENRRECILFWTGPLDQPDLVDEVEHPFHRATSVSCEVDSAWVTSFFFQLRRERRTARIQLHTHPDEAWHSQTDDTYALVPAPGFLSLVIPNFAAGAVSLEDAFLVEMSATGEWEPIELTTLQTP